MSFDADEEILQDFLVEAGEILEVLSEQLVELENRPDDAENECGGKDDEPVAVALELCKVFHINTLPFTRWGRV